MQLSAEVRWFQPGPIPAEVRAWFCDPAREFRFPPAGDRPRKDVYVLSASTELGIKRRGRKERLEVKGVLDYLPTPLRFGGVSVLPQLFCKWDSEALHLARSRTVEIVKTRWLRTFDTADEPCEVRLGGADAPPEVGCNVEVTAVTKDDEPWWTFGAEAFAFRRPGRTIQLVARALRRTMRSMANHPVDLGQARYLSYPEWIAEFPPKRQGSARRR